MDLHDLQIKVVPWGDSRGPLHESPLSLEGEKIIIVKECNPGDWNGFRVSNGGGE